jgi:outer membrane scaffolding protein for murein synthesis (MipA/OmpV family)
MNTGIEFGDRKYHRYFYEVPLTDATPNRPAYDPDPGISAFILSFRLIRDINTRVSIAGYTRWENLSKAAYRKSPLVKEKNNFIVGGALIWTIKQSETLVRSDISRSAF